MKRRIVQVTAMIAFLALMLFASAGTLVWLWAWVYIGLYLLGIAANAILMRGRQQTIAGRSSAAGMRNWDKVVGGLWGLCYFVVMPVVVGLDACLTWSEPIGGYSEYSDSTPYRLIPGVW